MTDYSQEKDSRQKSRVGWQTTVLRRMADYSPEEDGRLQSRGGWQTIVQRKMTDYEYSPEKDGIPRHELKDYGKLGQLAVSGVYCKAGEGHTSYLIPECGDQQLAAGQLLLTLAPHILTKPAQNISY